MENAVNDNWIRRAITKLLSDYGLNLPDSWHQRARSNLEAFAFHHNESLKAQREGDLILERFHRRRADAMWRICELSLSPRLFSPHDMEMTERFTFRLFDQIEVQGTYTPAHVTHPVLERALDELGKFDEAMLKLVFSGREKGDELDEWTTP
jgi:hypothetical protein